MASSRCTPRGFPGAGRDWSTSQVTELLQAPELQRPGPIAALALVSFQEALVHLARVRMDVAQYKDEEREDVAGSLKTLCSCSTPALLPWPQP